MKCGSFTDSTIESITSEGKSISVNVGSTTHKRIRAIMFDWTSTTKAKHGGKFKPQIDCRQQRSAVDAHQNQALCGEQNSWEVLNVGSRLQHYAQFALDFGGLRSSVEEGARMLKQARKWVIDWVKIERFRWIVSSVLCWRMELRISFKNLKFQEKKV